MSIPLRFHTYEWWNAGASTAWLKVPYRHLLTLCLEKRISRFSKRAGDDVLLEKSIDAMRFITAWEGFNHEPIRFGSEVQVEPGRIRNLTPYHQ